MEQKVRIPWEEWRLVKSLGKGGFGEVWEIERVKHGITEKAAMKVISIPQGDDEIECLQIEGYSDESITQRFSGFVDDVVREYGMMVQMKGNANIVYCDDYKSIQHEDGFGWDIYIKMELLTPMMKALKLVSTEQQIIQFAKDICSALVVCQKRKVIHRDIKPQNIFVSEDGVFKLGDFGIARTAERTTRATVGKGSYQFMAPEVKNDQPYGATADIYSLGLVLHWLLNERRSPFLPLPPAAPKHGDEEKAKQRRFAGEQIPAPKNGSKELREIVLKACAFDPKQRYQSAAEMLADLQALKSGFVPIFVPETNEVESVLDTDEEKTVGPDFGKQDPETELDTEKTVGPQFDKGKRPLTEEPKKKKHVFPIVLGAVAALSVAGAVLFFLRPQYGEWSEWSTSEPEQIPGRKIETSTEYRTRELLLLSTDNMEDVVGEVDHEEMGYGAWGEWGEWQTLSIESDEATEVEEQTQYRSREKEYTTSSQASMTGWTQYDSSSSSYWSEWSDWSVNAVTASETREVRKATQYRRGKILLKDTSDPSQQPQGYTLWYTWVDSSGVTWYRWTLVEWSAWTFEVVEPAELLEVQTRTVYQHRDYITDVIYSYWKWGDWTEWSFEAVKNTENTDVENRQVYRSRKAIEAPLYYYYDWSDWSGWNFDKPTVNDQIEVESRTVYRYVDRE